MRKQTGIDALNNHLFEAIEGLKNNSDPIADEWEKMDLQTAKAIAELGKVIIENYKLKFQTISMLAKADNPQEYKRAVIEAGFVEEIKELPTRISD